MVEDSVDLPIVVTTLPENILQEHELHMQSLDHIVWKACLLDGWWWDLALR
jgi:hypothetical protein